MAGAAKQAGRVDWRAQLRRAALQATDAAMIISSLRFAKTIAGLLFRRPLVSVSVIGVDASGRIALARRADNGLWGLPGGLVDWGETLETCAARELKEEVGLSLVAVDRLVGVYSDLDRDPRVHAVVVALAARVEGTIHPADLQEVTETRMASIPEIEAEIGLDALSHDHGRHLADFRDGRSAVLA